MRNFCIACLLCMGCAVASADVVTTFDFSAGPESGIEMPAGKSWPASGSVVMDADAVFRIDNVSIRATNETSPSRIYKASGEDRWYLRPSAGTKLVFMGGSDNLAGIRIYLCHDKESELSELPQMPVEYTATYDEENCLLEWAGSNPSVFMDLGGKLYIDKIEVTTDGAASQPDTEAGSGDDGGAVTYLDLQGRPVQNPSGGTFIRISSGLADKVYIP